MRTGDSRGRQGGFTYLLLLFGLALGSVGLLALAESWLAGALRERETELLFRGNEIGRALASYAAATPAGQRRSPLALEDLLVDTRASPPRHHLRRLYTDPFTGRADWAQMRDSEGGIVGVHSLSQALARRLHDVPVTVSETAGPPRVGDWRFGPPVAPPPTTTRASKSVSAR